MKPVLAMLTAASTLLSAACVQLPPKLSPPSLPTQAPLAIDRSGAPDEPGGAAARTEPVAGGGWPAQDWWRRYEDPTLDALIARALAHSPSLAATRARFSAASASVRTVAAAAGVQVDANADYARQRLSDNGLLPPKFLGFNWYNQTDLGLSVGYTFDWWGKEHAAIDAALDEAHASAADHAAAALTLASSVAETYFGWQSDRARLRLAQAAVADYERQRSFAARRLAAEIARSDELLQLDSSYAAAQEQQIALDNSARLRVVMLAALLNCRPEELPPLQERPLPAADTQLPAQASIDLIARRADIEASRWRVEAAVQNVGAARAGFLPDISLRALVGLSSIDMGRLLEAGSAVPQFTAALHLPIFDAGQLRGRYAGSRSQLDSAIASYESAVVTAAREVGSQALALQDYRGRRVQRAAVVAQADAQRRRAAERAAAGITDARPPLVAESNWLAARDSLLQLDAAALDAELDLIRALGGGYQRATAVASASIPEP